MGWCDSYSSRISVVVMGMESVSVIRIPMDAAEKLDGLQNHLEGRTKSRIVGDAISVYEYLLKDGWSGELIGLSDYLHRTPE